MNEADHATLINLAACLVRSVEGVPTRARRHEWAAMLRMMGDFIEHADGQCQSIPAARAADRGHCVS